MAFLSKKDTSVLALPSTYRLPMVDLYQYLDCIGKKDVWIQVWNQILIVLFMRCRVLLPPRCLLV